MVYNRRRTSRRTRHLSRHRVRSVDGVPRARAQRTPPAAANPLEPETAPAATTRNTHWGRPNPADAAAMRGAPSSALASAAARSKAHSRERGSRRSAHGRSRRHRRISQPRPARAICAAATSAATAASVKGVAGHARTPWWSRPGQRAGRARRGLRRPVASPSKARAGPFW
jgi:hypothetical protein